MRDTRQRILDAAEALFAQRGYDATPLEDIAAIVGVRASAIFRHFDNKWALYQAVIDRLLSGYVELLRAQGLTDQPIEGLERAFRYNLAHPNLARLLQHAALNAGKTLDYIAERWIGPFMAELGQNFASSKLLADSAEYTDRDIYLAFNNLIYGFITMANLNSRIYGVNVAETEAQARQFALLAGLAGGLLAKSPADQSSQAIQT